MASKQEGSAEAEVKFVSIAAGHGEQLFALADDGSVFERVGNPEPRTSAEYEPKVWRRIPGPKPRG